MWFISIKYRMCDLSDSKLLSVCPSVRPSVCSFGNLFLMFNIICIISSMSSVFCCWFNFFLNFVTYFFQILSVSFIFLTLVFFVHFFLASFSKLHHWCSFVFFCFHIWFIFFFSSLWSFVGFRFLWIFFCVVFVIFRFILRIFFLCSFCCFC